MAYVLFSAVGTSDPVSEDHDGPFLHICRIYKPCKVYLYLSAEMLELHRQDDRYRDALERLGRYLNHSFDVRFIERPALCNVQIFDLFYNEFESEIENIRNENPDDTLLLNVSSGTPAMKSALQLLAALSDGAYTPIQVRSPNNRTNHRRDDIRQYDKELFWECNRDHPEPAEIRCKPSPTLNLKQKIKTEILLRHLAAYDYGAALTVAESIPGIPPKALDLLRLAAARYMLKTSEADRLQAKTGERILPGVSGDVREAAEYLLWLNIKLRRREYADFMRGISPATVTLMDLYCERRLDIRIKDFCVGTGRGRTVRKLSREALSRTERGREILERLDQAFQPYKDTFYSSAQLAVLIEAFGPNPETVKRVRLLRDAETAVRNPAAHEITYVDDELIRGCCGTGAQGIWDALRKLMCDTVPLPNEIWDSYDRMNARIEEALREPAPAAAGQPDIGRE